MVAAPTGEEDGSGGDDAKDDDVPQQRVPSMTKPSAALPGVDPLPGAAAAAPDTAEVAEFATVALLRLQY